MHLLIVDFRAVFWSDIFWLAAGCRSKSELAV